MLRRVFGLLLTAFALCGVAHAADLQVRTTDGQTIQGEYLGTEDNVVRIRTKYGVVAIPSKNVVTLTAVASTKGKDDDTGAAAPEAELPQTFPQPKTPNIASLVSARMAALPEPTKNERQELHRAVRNFGDSTEASRQKIIRTLQAYGYKAMPFIAASYGHPAELPERVALLRAIAVPGRHFSTLLLMDTHATILNAMENTANEPPPLPPDYLTKRDRQRPQGAAQKMQVLAGMLEDVEGYAATAGGPYNAFFLLSVYTARYADETADALLQNLSRDKARLAATTSNHNKGSTAWPGADRVLLCEMLLPLLFKENAELTDLATDTLKKLLPDKHPKWDAPQDEWVTWWNENRAKAAK